MPIITFLPLGKTVDVAKGTRLYDAAIAAGLPIASSCDGQGTCGKCNMQVVAGGQNVTRASRLELRLLKKEGKPMTDRISCLALVMGDCTMTTTYW
jgi:ferredoxin, 2Fe-2S